MRKLARRGGDDGGRIVPVRVVLQAAGAVLDGVPIDQTGEPRIADDVAEPLVGTLRVGDQVAGDKLVVELAQGQPEALRRVVGNDLVRLPDDAQGGGRKPLVDELLGHSSPTWT